MPTANPVTPPPTFASLGLGDRLLRALVERGFVAPTPVQARAIPIILGGRDVWASARTGSGKTAAFVLPVLHALDVAAGIAPRGGVSALVLVPTRELAKQIAEVIASLSVHLAAPVKTCVAVGGVSINPQMIALRGGADVVVATPGRLLDLVDHGALRLSSVKTVVLDEADRLLAVGFADELDRLRSALPAHCQKLLFSATFPAGVRALVAELLSDPVGINVDEGRTPDPSAILQRAIVVDERRRTGLLRHLLQAESWPRVLVFVATKHGTEHVALKLRRLGVSVASLHGELSQGARTQALDDFAAGRVQVLVATDLAGRGLDIAELAAVVNYDLPRSAVDYLHRIGRTGRAGHCGVALSFVTASNSAHFDLIERRHHLARSRETVPGFEPTDVAVAPLHPHGGVKGKRKSKKDKLREAAAVRGKPG